MPTYTDSPECPYCGYADEHWTDDMTETFYDTLVTRGSEVQCLQCHRVYRWRIEPCPQHHTETVPGEAYRTYDEFGQLIEDEEDSNEEDDE